jgi:OmpA-OmpF porin, OOP family
MAQNLLDVINRSIGDELVTQIARRLGESDAATRLAIGGLVPVMIGCMAQRAASAEGAKSLLRMITSMPIDAKSLGAPAGLLTEDTGSLERMITMGPGIVGSLLGDQAMQLAGAVAGISAVRTSSASWLSAFIASFVCALVAREVQSNKLNANAFQSLMMAQRVALQGALDRRILMALGVKSLNSYLAEVNGGGLHTASPHATATTPPAAGSSNAWLIGVLLIIVFVAAWLLAY